jgi:hypothetical protein
MAHCRLPTVQVQLGPLSVSIQAFTWGGLSDAATFVSATDRQRFKRKAGRPVLPGGAARQVNPAWQYGGLSPIQSLLFQPGENFTLAKVNGVDQYVLYSRRTASAPLRSIRAMCEVPGARPIAPGTGYGQRRRPDFGRCGI